MYNYCFISDNGCVISTRRINHAYFGEILGVLAQVHWQARGLTGYDQGTPEPRLSIDPWPCWERSAA